MEAQKGVMVISVTGQIFEQLPGIESDCCGDKLLAQFHEVAPTAWAEGHIHASRLEHGRGPASMTEHRVLGHGSSYETLASVKYQNSRANVPRAFRNVIAE